MLHNKMSKRVNLWYSTRRIYFTVNQMKTNNSKFCKCCLCIHNDIRHTNCWMVEDNREDVIYGCVIRHNHTPA